MDGVKKIRNNKWFKFSVYSILYILLFVVWTGNPWMILGIVIIYDIFISKIMYRLFWRKHKELKKKNKVYRKVMEWVEAIVFAVVVTHFIKLFIFGMYVIPTPSMEKSLLVGDYLCVSKIAYGPTVPNTPLALPLVHNTMPFSQTKRSYSEIIKWPYHRLKGFGKVKLGDVVVFNFPAGDTVILEDQAVSYYDYLYFYQHKYGVKEGRQKLYSEYKIISRPVDKRENYVKRCVGLPGDTIMISASELFVNGKLFKDIPGRQFDYFVQTDGTPINQSVLEEMGISNGDYYFNKENGSYRILLTKYNYDRISKMRNIKNIVQYVAEDPNSRVFPHDESYSWNEDNYGPLWIPKKGETVDLNSKNLPLYRSIIENYELHKLEVKDGIIYIDSAVADKYTFGMDYYFMMGDNRDNSADSRFWGFVPEDHIVGKASFIWMSTDANKGRFPFNIRWGRLFSKVR